MFGCQCRQHAQQLATIQETLSYILVQLQQIQQKEAKVMTAVDDLKTAVTAETTVNQSAITLLNGLSAQLAAALAAPGDTNAAIQAVIDNLNANTNTLAAAVTANTPAQVAAGSDQSAPNTVPAPAPDGSQPSS